MKIKKDIREDDIGKTAFGYAFLNKKLKEDNYGRISEKQVRNSISL